MILVLNKFGVILITCMHIAIANEHFNCTNVAI